MATKFGKMVTYHEGLSLIHSWSHVSLLSPGLARSRDKLNPLYLHLQCLSTPYSVRWWLTVRGPHPYSHPWARDQPEVTWQFEKSISAFKIFMATKLTRMLTSGRSFITETLQSSLTSCYFAISLIGRCVNLLVYYCKSICPGRHDLVVRQHDEKFLRKSVSL